MGVDPVSLGIFAVGTGLSLFGTRRARREAKAAQREQIAFDARTARLESKSILEEAEIEAVEIRREGELLGKKQTALTAKAGLKIGRGTAEAIQEETRRLTEKDIATTKEAAERKSKQLLETFPEPEVGFGKLPKILLGNRKQKTPEQPTALAEGDRQNGNFIKSPRKHKSFILQLGL